MLLRAVVLFIFSVLLSPASCAFIRGHSLTNINCSAVALEPLVIFVSIDVEKSLMKFLINTKVSTNENQSSIHPVITDVDFATNRYTTLNVDIEFMGKSFIRENLRFCDILTVKNTSLYEDTYRFDGLDLHTTVSPMPQATGFPNPTPNPKAPAHHHSANDTASSNSTTIKRRRDLDDSGSLRTSSANSNSNSSIAALFSNKTSELFHCPLYQNDSIVFYYQADISENLNKLGSYTARFTIVSNNEDSDIIGGAIGYVTASVRSKALQRRIFIGVLGICAFYCFLYFLIIVLSPNQESHNPFLIEASAICNEPLLKHLEADPFMLFSYLQFAVFMGGLSIQYPGFFQYAMGKISWCALLNINVFSKWVTLPSLDSDNVYLSYYSGLKALTSYTSKTYVRYSWANFIMCLLIWIIAAMIIYQIFICLRVLAQKQKMPLVLRKLFVRRTENTHAVSGRNKSATGFTYSWSTNLFALLGHFFKLFLTIFGLPFLVLTIYMLFTASEMNFFEGDPSGLTQANAFSDSIPYQVLSPMSDASNVIDSLNLWHQPHESPPTMPVLSVVFGSIMLGVWLASALFFLYYYLSPISIRGREKNNVNKLYTSVQAIVTWAYLYNAYKPSKVYFVAVNFLECVVSSIFIATLQRYPTVQIALLITLQSASLLLLVLIKPFFLGLSWHSLPLLQSIARLLVAILNIPFLDQFNNPETIRSRVAICQLVIHGIIVIAYALHLIYCVAITIRAIVKLRRKVPVEEKATHEMVNDVDDRIFNEFEFRQVPMHQTQDEMDVQSSMRSSLDDETDYYRSKSERLLREMEHHDMRSDTKDESSEDAENASIDFQQAERRIQQTDYTTREADRIFHKYFSANEMDPEMRALWESRNWNENLRPLQAKAEVKKPETHFFKTLWQRFQPSKKTGFEVARRRPIVVAPKREEEEKELE